MSIKNSIKTDDLKLKRYNINCKVMMYNMHVYYVEY